MSEQPAQHAARPSAEDLVALLRERGVTLATAESLTGGGVGAAITSVPGASYAYVGGVVSYATRVKVELLGVPEQTVARHGVVSAECAEQMARGVRELLRADLGLSCTGVAGPDAQEGKPVGTAFVAVADGDGVAVEELRLSGVRAAIRAGVVDAALALAARVVVDRRDDLGRAR